jgi:Uncharacterised nucleotidyltransferase
VAKRNGLTGSFWPSEAQQLLLRAVLLEGEAGEEAWRALSPGFDTQRFESGSLGLLALLYERRGADDPRLARLKGVRRFLWYQDQVGLEALRDALEGLRQQDVPTIVLSGAALIERYYGRQGVCPLVEPAVLVTPDRAAVAGEALGEAGFRPSGQPTGRRQSYTRERGHTRQTLAVHWRLAPELDPLADTSGLERVWGAAEALEVQGIPTRALAAADELLTSCVVGARSRPRPDFQWIVDAVTIMRASRSTVDWERLVAEATRRRCSVRLSDALTFLVDALDAPVPRDSLVALAAATTRRERVAQQLAGRGSRVTGNLPALLAAHVVASRDESIPRLVLSVPHFLAAEWGVERASQLPGAVARRVAASLSAARTRRHASS